MATSGLSQGELPISENVFSGPMVSALVGLTIGIWTLLLVHHVSVQHKAFETRVNAFGSWVPGAVGSGPGGSIGPYAGKELIALAAWLLSWTLLHFALRKRNPPLGLHMKVFLWSLVTATLLFLHPIADPIFSGLLR